MFRLKVILSFLLMVFFLLTANAGMIKNNSQNDWLSGEYVAVSLRRSGNVASPAFIDNEATNLIGKKVFFGNELRWLEKGNCKTWKTVEGGNDAGFYLSDPILSDVTLAPLEGETSQGDQRILKTVDLYCGDEMLERLFVIDKRVFIISSRSGATNIIFEKPLSEAESEKFQLQLKDMKFYSGDITREMDAKSRTAIAFYAEYRGAEYRFADPVITENLLDGLSVLSDQ